MTLLKERAEMLHASHGVIVLPTVENKKHSSFCRKDVTCLEAHMQSLWKSVERPTGAWLLGDSLPEGYLILDVDAPADRIPSVLSELGIDEPSLRVNTVSGGCHYYLRAPRHLNLKPSTAISPSLLNGESGQIEVRAKDIRQGIMAPGSSAKAKDGEVRQYRTDSEAAIWSLEWPMLSNAQADALEAALGATKPTDQPEGEDHKSAASALLSCHVMPLLTHFSTGVELANEWCTTFGGILGHAVRSVRVPSRILADEVWSGIMSLASADMARDLKNQPRHEVSFRDSFVRAVEQNKQAYSVMLNSDLKSINGYSEAKDPDTLKLEVAIQSLFDGGVRLSCIVAASDKDEYRLTTLSSEDMEVAGPVLSDNDLLHSGARSISLPNGLANRDGIPWISYVCTRLKILKEKVQAFRNSGVSDSALKNWLGDNAASDSSSLDFSRFRLPDLIRAFNEDDYRMRFKELKGPAKSRHAWTLAPRNGQNKTAEPFIVLHKDEYFFVITPRARKRLVHEQIESVTKGNAPDLLQSTPNGGHVELYKLDQDFVKEVKQCC